MHKNAQKVEWKTPSKISCHCTWLLHAKNCPSWWRFHRSFLTASKPSRRPITAAKRKQKKKKARRNLDFCACPSQRVVKGDASGKKGKLSCCKCLFHQIKAYLAEIQPCNHQNVQKTHFWQKALGVIGLLNYIVILGDVRLVFTRTWMSIFSLDELMDSNGTIIYITDVLRFIFSKSIQRSVGWVTVKLLLTEPVS